MNHFRPLLPAAAALCALAGAAHAAPTQSLTLLGETRDYTDARSPLSTVQLEYRRDLGTTDILVAPSLNRQRIGTAIVEAAGGAVTIDHQWSPALSTTTALGLAENAGIAPWLSAQQDFHVKLAGHAVVSLGARLVRYRSGDAVFLNAGVRRYFRGGSIAYRLTRVEAGARGSLVAHLANLSLDDARGSGRTQLWLGLGSSAEDRRDDGRMLSGKDWAATLRRVQPLAGPLSLTPAIGYSSLALSQGRVGALSLALGLKLALD